ncbi:replication protein A 70 [Nomia melanderi]|uniref:replication protein A 70 n=1 Tax=Nomia melanderi TaxID=2448451 RepID=UPI00130451E9|nr:replication protein A 70 kDa DNA-binding subunit [Nomia melanderi]XP_031833472.1 replication protein A 70 kDa DNA-binding subunit [Nomia melanderi]XP_031833473.1 replication protein A 70 kDa DNA-binding subunit [Nomia melanderi]XP_031833475.1 replication protein A 70 kDa DNA-binding subunit [Nomia melanderi]XP_031833476.1 replication protein A 70 kDa DNA-binding subunit [Nomia melanderi]XP_031833477.1 replication protein A 70 kDa DNA-binding subunit [Nomia melanderi]XP_031833478.1 replicat
MHSLTEGALDKIMNGIDVDKPVLQILGHKKLASTNSGERYRLLVSDGKSINSFSMLATQLNSMITDNILTEFSICQINRYAISMVNNAGKQKRVMVILNIDVKVPGNEVGHRIGNPINADFEGDSKPAQSAQPGRSVQSPPKQKNNYAQKSSTNQASTNDISTVPIVALSPYQNRWVIKARVVSKSGIRTWSNSRGEGKLFSMDIVDESGEIRCTAFRDQCDKFYDMLEVGKVYYISRATLKTANKQFNNLKNDYEMTLIGDSEIIPCYDAGNEIPSLRFDFMPISQVENKEKNDIMDILGVVKSCSDLQVLTSRTTGREMKKKDVNLVDESNTMVCLTLWGSQAEDFDGSMNPVLAIKGARVGEFNGGKNLSTISSTVLQVDPDIPEAHRLRGWFNTVGRNEEIRAISRGLGDAGGGVSGPFLTFKEAKDKELGYNGPDVYTVKATVNMIRVENSLYKSCPTESCKKKLIDQANDMYRCEKCDKEFPNYRYRLLASLSLADWTGHQWATAFSEEAEKMIGITAQELGELKENDNEAFLEKFANATFKSFIFKLRVKMEEFNDEKRLKATCLGVSPVDYKVYNDHLLTQIKELAGIGKA